MTHTIGNGQLKITIESLGAELISVEHGGKERVWQNPTGEWAGHGPLLFPVCGHCGLRLGGKDYPIKAHGFAKRMEFTLVEKSEESLAFEIAANEETKAVYPFDFVFRVTYRISGSELTVCYDVKNTAKTPLYFACGGHESFALEQNVDAYEIRFEKDETFLHHNHDDDGYMAGTTVDFGAGKVFPLPRDFLQKGVTVIFKEIASRKVWLCEKASGKALAEISFDGFSNLLLWRGGDGAFICIEPWTNLPDPAGAADVEFPTKAGVIEVAGESVKTMTRKIAYL